MAEAKDNLVPVAKVASDLRIRPQTIYSWLSKGLLQGEKIGRSQHVDPAEAKKVLESESSKPKTQGGHRINWNALTDYLKEREENEVVLNVIEVKETIESPKTRTEMLHHWDPYRATVRGQNQGSGLRAIRAAGFDIIRIDFAYSKVINLVGVATITVRRSE